MEEQRLRFYAFVCNGNTAALCHTSEEALEQLSHYIASDNTDSYGIEPVDGVWELIYRIVNMGNGDKSDDEYMEEVIEMVYLMIQRKKEIIKSVSEKEKSKQSKANTSPDDNVSPK